MKSINVTVSILFLLLTMLSVPAIAKSSDDTYRIEVNANPYQNGDAFDIGISTPYLFKFKENSRHQWSLFTTVGTNTLYNTPIEDEENVAETINIEVIVGLRALAPFYKDLIYQYGKVALDIIFYDDNLRDREGFGVLLESGLEFNSSFSDLSFHVGLRWRAGLPANDNVAGEPDFFEGVSMVLGSRFTF